jgi:hypothetical protein
MASIPKGMLDKLIPNLEKALEAQVISAFTYGTSAVNYHQLYGGSKVFPSYKKYDRISSRVSYYRTKEGRYHFDIRVGQPIEIVAETASNVFNALSYSDFSELTEDEHNGIACAFQSDEKPKTAREVMREHNITPEDLRRTPLYLRA